LPSRFGGPRLHASDMRLLKLQFGGCPSMVMRRSFSEMNADNALSIVVLPEPVAARDDRGDARLHRRGEQAPPSGGLMAPMLTSLFRFVRFLGEFADRNQRPVDADRTYRDVDTRAVEQGARVAKRVRFIDTSSDCRDDLVDDAQQMRLVPLKRQATGSSRPLRLDKGRLVAIDQDVV